MQKKFIFNPATLTFEYSGESRTARRLKVAGLVLAAVAMMLFYFWLFVFVFKVDFPRSAILKANHSRWESKVDLLKREIDNYDRTLSGIEERDDDVYRSIYGLSIVPSDEAPSPAVERKYPYLGEDGVNPELKRLVYRVDAMERRAYRRSKTLDEVSVVSKEAGDMVSCIPAVPPILPRKGTYFMSSGYGYRTDPVYGGQAFHRGQDFAARIGTPVYATGDGVVELVEFQFRGYGNEVIINHGYGYQTLYAHLNTIEVQKGMKVQRGERIGTVGRTGKATGPHLHYEVIYMGRPQIPRNFFDMDMPVSEYQAMVRKREDESPRGKTSSTSELLRKRDGNKAQN